MRLLILIAIGLFGAALLAVSGVFQLAPAKTRLAGVSVGVTGYTVSEVGDRGHRLDLVVRIASPQALDVCVGFTLDEPFASRRMRPASGGPDCVRPTAGVAELSLAFDRLTDDDLTFPSHTLVWGVDGGRCGPIMEAFGVCVVEQAGTAVVELPSRTVLHTFGPIGSLFPVFSFEPLP